MMIQTGQLHFVSCIVEEQFKENEPSQNVYRSQTYARFVLIAKNKQILQYWSILIRILLERDILTKKGPIFIRGNLTGETEIF